MRRGRLRYVSLSILLLLLIIPITFADSYTVPELIYYKFDSAGESTVANQASAPVGSNPTTVLGLSLGSTGQFGSALVGNGGSSSSNYIDTGWQPDFGTGSWTISFWLDDFPSSTDLYYLFGDTSGMFRCFLGGIAGEDGLILRRSDMTDVLVSGISAAQPIVVHFVYDASIPEIRAYLNGELNNTVAQSAQDITSSTHMTVGGYNSSTALPNGALLDEFRVYNRALSADEVAATWNMDLLSPLSKDVSPSSAEPGAAITYTLHIANIHSITVTNVIITDTLPAEIASPQVISSGLDLGDITGTHYAWEMSSLAPGQSGVITVTGVLTSPLATGSFTNTATAEISGTLFTSEAPLEVLNAPPVADAGEDRGAAPGSEVTLDGNGSSDANGDDLTYGWNQTGGPTVSLSDTAVISPAFTMPVTATEPLTFTLIVTDTADVASAPDEVVISIGAGSADLGIAQTARTHGLHAITYTVVATNNGPDDAAGAVISDTLPANVTDVTWTSVGAGGATGAANGSGDLDDTLTAFPSGGVITYTLSGSLDGWGHIANTVEIIVPNGFEDTDTDNNSSTVHAYILDMPLVWR